MDQFVQSADILNDHSILIEEKNKAIKSLSNLTNRLVVTKVPHEVYLHESSKSEFEKIFNRFDSDCNFIYLPSFRRVLITMSSPKAAFLARLKTQGWRLTQSTSTTNNDVSNIDADDDDSGIRCYFAEVDPTEARRLGTLHLSNNNRTSFEDEELTEEEMEMNSNVVENLNHLAPPKPNRLFLLSPPASPPVGWEPRPEAEPLVNYDLLNALASMEPGKEHELHPPERDQPSIVVTPCEATLKGPPKIQQTACPARKA